MFLNLYPDSLHAHLPGLQTWPIPEWCSWGAMGSAISRHAAPMECRAAVLHDSFQVSSQYFSPLPDDMRNINTALWTITRTGATANVGKEAWRGIGCPFLSTMAVFAFSRQARACVIQSSHSKSSLQSHTRLLQNKTKPKHLSVCGDLSVYRHNQGYTAAGPCSPGPEQPLNNTSAAAVQGSGNSQRPGRMRSACLKLGCAPALCAANRMRLC